MNPGVQHYGLGTLLTAVRDEMDTLCCSLPVPRPAQSGAQSDMSVFHNASGGCFHESCLVSMMVRVSLIVDEETAYSIVLSL